jgi:cytidylate kinase
MTVKIITIDGPSGAGKGTLAAKLAAHYRLQILDSGAIYRLLGLKLLKNNLLDQLDDQLSQCVHLAENLDITFKSDANHALQVFLDQQDVSQHIRTETVGAYASKVAAVAELRAALLQRQRNFASGVGVVADGRDMGTLVFPEAKAKLFLTASAASRAERRAKQLQQMGVAVRMDDILSNIEARDRRDTQRAVAPLKPATDAKIIDSSQLSIDEVFAQMVSYVDQCFAIEDNQT